MTGDSCDGAQALSLNDRDGAVIHFSLSSRVVFHISSGQPIAGLISPAWYNAEKDRR